MDYQKTQFQDNVGGRIRNQTNQVTLPNVPIFIEQQKASDEFRPAPFAPPADSAPPGPITTIHVVEVNPEPEGCNNMLETAIVYKEKFRETVKSLLGRIMMRNVGDLWAFVFYLELLFITIGRLIAGATKLGSNCDQEKDVAVYLFVKASLGVFFWITFLVLGVSERMKRGVDKNLFVELYIYVDSLFGFAWFIVGMVWIFGNYSSMKSTCPLFVNDWNFHFINFAMFLAAHDIIFFVAIFIYAMYKLCDEDSEDDY